MILDNEDQRTLILEALLLASYPGSAVKIAAQTMEAVEKALVKVPDVVGRDGQPEA